MSSKLNGRFITPCLGDNASRRMSPFSPPLLSVAAASLQGGCAFIRTSIKAAKTANSSAPEPKHLFDIHA